MNMQHTSSSSGKIVAGLIIMTVGITFLLRQMGYFFPQLLFSWPMILIVTGLFHGFKTGFRDFGWLLLLGLGMAFLFDHRFPVFHITQFVWPLLIIGAGLFMILNRNRSCPDRAERRQRRQKRREQFFQHANAASESPLFQTREPQASTQSPEHSAYPTENTEPFTVSNSEFVDITAILGGNKRNILSKNVKGADVTAIMGGVELNFAQADINGRVNINLTLIMGGCKLVVPSNWQIISEITPIIGIIEDKRNIIPPTNPENPKILILRGLALMGGIEITSYIYR